MNNSERLSLTVSHIDGKLKCVVRVYDLKLLNFKAKINIRQLIKGLFSTDFEISKKLIESDEFELKEYNEIYLDFDEKHYHFVGKLLEITYFARLIINDGVIINTSIMTRFTVKNYINYKENHDSYNAANKIILLKDKFNIYDSIFALQTIDRVKFFIVLLGLSIIPFLSIFILLFKVIKNILIQVVTNNTLIQFINDILVQVVLSLFLTVVFILLIFKLFRTDLNLDMLTGKFKNSVGTILYILGNILLLYFIVKYEDLLIVLVLILFFILILNSYIKYIFPDYLKVSLKKDLLIEKGRQYKISDILHGDSYSGLENLKLEVIVCNLERYKPGKKIYEEYFNSFILYTKNIDYIQKGENITNFLNGTFSFDSFFDKIYHEQEIYKNYGIFIHCEIRFIHDKLIDKKIIIPSSCFKLEDFRV